MVLVSATPSHPYPRAGIPGPSWHRGIQPILDLGTRYRSNGDGLVCPRTSSLPVLGRACQVPRSCSPCRRGSDPSQKPHPTCASNDITCCKHRAFLKSVVTLKSALRAEQTPPTERKLKSAGFTPTLPETVIPYPSKKKKNRGQGEGEGGLSKVGGVWVAR